MSFDHIEEFTDPPADFRCRRHATIPPITKLTVITVIGALVLAGCGGGSPASPDPPLTLAEAAPAMTQAVASTIAGALEGSASASNAWVPQLWLARFFAPLVPQTLHAQSAFLRNCSTGGSVRIERVVVALGRYTLTNSSATFTTCGFNPGRRAATMDGSLLLNGVWCPGQPSCTGPSSATPATPVQTTGSLSVSDIGSVPMNGAIGLGAFTFDLGCPGCIFQGDPRKGT